MPGFEAIYKQTVTLFNRVPQQYGEELLWYPTVLEGVHLVIDHSSVWNQNGGAVTDNVRLHIRYLVKNGKVVVGQKPYYLPKDYRRLERPEDAITFGYGNNDDFDFFVEGVFTEYDGPVPDSIEPRMGFYNYMNKKYDNVFAITSVAKYNLIPHFEIMAR